MTTLDDWQMIESKPLFKVKSHCGLVYCKTRWIVAKAYKLYKKGTKGFKLINQLVWLNYSMSSILAPKLSLCLSIALICVFFVSS